MRVELSTLPGGYVVVAPSGEIDIVTAPGVRNALARAADQAVTGVIADLADVTFMDAAGLGALAGAAGRARHLPDGIRLVAVPARVLRLLALTGLDRHLPAFPVPQRQAQAHARRPYQGRYGAVDRGELPVPLQSVAVGLTACSPGRLRRPDTPTQAREGPRACPAHCRRARLAAGFKRLASGVRRHADVARACP